MTPTRRSVLLAGLASIVALGAGTATLGLRGTSRVEPSGPLSALSEDEYSVLSAIADTLFPGSATLPTGTAAGIPMALDHVVSTMHPTDQDEFRQALGLIENALVGALLDQRTTTFTGSSPAVRSQTLRAWQTSRLHVRRQAFKALKGLCAGAYWSQPEMGRTAGYLGPMDYGQSTADKPTVFHPEAPCPDELGCVEPLKEDP